VATAPTEALGVAAEPGVPELYPWEVPRLAWRKPCSAGSRRLATGRRATEIPDMDVTPELDA
jgi:hypothetical protein